jgi:hypothetical protein
MLNRNYLLTLKGVSVLSNKDEKEFYQLLEISEGVNLCAFENNWPYILQSTRNSHLKFSYKNSIVYFTLRYTEENSKKFVVIVNSLGKQRNEAILEFCKILGEKSINFLIKNIDKQDLPFWKNKGFIETTKSWSSFSFRDDNSFPLHIISSETIKNKSLNSDYRRIINHFDKENIKIELFDFSQEKAAKDLLNKNAQFLSNKNVESQEEVIRAHLTFFDKELSKQLRIQFIKNDKLIAFSSFTLVNNVSFGNVLICENKKDIMKYFAYQSMRFTIVSNPEITYFSIQGSENKGQNFFKERYKPSFSIEKTHITAK